MPLVSIIIPTFNSELYIRETLESAVSQTLKDIEIIIADCASKDKTLEIINEYAKNDSRIKVLNRPMEYVGVSRNAALAEATGDYIMFMDSDDWLNEDACEVLYNQISNNNDDMVFFAHRNYLEEAGTSRCFNGNIAAFENYYNGQSFHLWEINEPFFSGSEAWYKIYKKSFLDKYNIRFGKEKFGEDTIFFCECIVNAQKVSVMNRALYNYRKMSTSSTTIYGEKYWKDIFSTRPKCYEIFAKSKHSDIFLKTCLPYIIRSVMYWYSRWSSLRGFPQKEYYALMRQFFLKIMQEHPEEVDAAKDFIECKAFKHIIKEDWNTRKIINFMRMVFSIRNDETNHKVFKIFGISIKIKKTGDRKKYKKLKKFYDKKIVDIKSKVSQGKKIRVAFYVNDSKWKCQSLFDAMQKSSHYEPFILVGKNSVTKVHPEYQTIDDIKKIYQNFISKGMQTYYAYDIENKVHIPLDIFRSDIIFYSRQFNIDQIYDISNVGKNILTCYVPYFISNSPIDVEAGYNFHNLLWKYYVINDDTVKEYCNVMQNKGDNLKAVGYPVMDQYLKNTSKDKNYVIYAPHWSLGDSPLKYATFDWNGEFMLEFAKAHREIKWVFKPHPILKGRLVELGLMTKEEVEKYYLDWSQIGVKYEGFDYIDLFKESKAMITDCGSFLAEYMPTKNPVILLRSRRATPYNFLAKKVTKYYYSVWNVEQLEEKLNSVILKGRDPWKERRLAVLESLNLVTNASQNIINDLNMEFGIK